MPKTMEIYGQKLHLKAAVYDECHDCIAQKNEALCSNISCLNQNLNTVYDCGTSETTVWWPDDPKAFEMALLLHGE